MFVALCVLVTKYDRTEDSVANRQVVDLTGIAPRHVRSALASLSAKGVIHRIPGHGVTASRVGFHIPEGTETVPSERTESVPSGGDRNRPPEGTETDTRGDAHASASEVFSEVFSEERERSADPDPAGPVDKLGLVRKIVNLSRHGHDELQQTADLLDADALQRLVDAKFTTTWCSQLKAKCEKERPAPTRTFAQASYDQCATCTGNSWVPKTKDGPVDDVVPCPKCRPNGTLVRTPKAVAS